MGLQRHVSRAARCAKLWVFDDGGTVCAHLMSPFQNSGWHNRHVSFAFLLSHCFHLVCA